MVLACLPVGRGDVAVMRHYVENSPLSLFHQVPACAKSHIAGRRQGRGWGPFRIVAKLFIRMSNGFAEN